MFATAPDLLRLLVIPLFGWAALRDVRTRRLPNRIWPPLYLFGLVLIGWELLARWPLSGPLDTLYLVQVGISLLFVAPLGYAFWYFGAFGGADAKALIGLAIVLPTFPTYYLDGLTLPLVETTLGVFSLTVLTNTVLVGICYPLGLALYNLVAGRTSPERYAATGGRSLATFLARPVSVGSVTERHGRLFETREGFTRSGLDLDALRMYLRWRGLTLAELRDDPDRYRDPDSVGETHDPTDGGTHVGPATDGGEVVDDEGADGEAVADAADVEPAAHDDPWAAERFLDEIEGSAYGTDAATLREGLAVVAERDTVWVTPGMPFVVPMFVGLVVAFTYGDLLFAAMGAVGLV